MKARTNKDLAVLQMAPAVGMELVGNNPRKGLKPCLRCGATDRTTANHHDPRRGPVGLTPNGKGWRCFVCDSGGDAVTLYALATRGRADLSKDEWRAVFAELDALNVAALPCPKFTETKPPRAQDVQGLWNACVPVNQDTLIELWLRNKGLTPDDVARVVSMDLARALRDGATVPRWARFGDVPWSKSGHRVITPMFDATGRRVTLHARHVNPGAKDKAASPVGHSMGNTVMACPLGRRLLAGERDAIEQVRNSRARMLGAYGIGLVIAEGVPDFLEIATNYEGDERPAVFGIVSGSWRDGSIAARIPDGSRVVIATDNDKTGDKYANEIFRTIGHRCKVLRWRPAQEATSNVFH